MDTDQKILLAVQALIQKYGVRKFTVDQLASSLHISKKTIYNHFNSKDQIIGICIKQITNSNYNKVKSLVTSDLPFLKKFELSFVKNTVTNCQLVPWKILKITILTYRTKSRRSKTLTSNVLINCYPRLNKVVF